MCRRHIKYAPSFSFFQVGLCFSAHVAYITDSWRYPHPRITSPATTQVLVHAGNFCVRFLQEDADESEFRWVHGEARATLRPALLLPHRPHFQINHRQLRWPEGISAPQSGVKHPPSPSPPSTFSCSHSHLPSPPGKSRLSPQRDDSEQKSRGKGQCRLLITQRPPTKPPRPPGPPADPPSARLRRINACVITRFREYLIIWGPECKQ